MTNHVTVHVITDLDPFITLNIFNIGFMINKARNDETVNVYSLKQKVFDKKDQKCNCF